MPLLLSSPAQDMNRWTQNGVAGLRSVFKVRVDCEQTNAVTVVTCPGHGQLDAEWCRWAAICGAVLPARARRWVKPFVDSCTQRCSGSVATLFA
eukprot:1160729-Pelagomonas_calceolata.AAC.12